jgi:hypothetical protein
MRAALARCNLTAGPKKSGARAKQDLLEWGKANLFSLAERGKADRSIYELYQMKVALVRE